MYHIKEISYTLANMTNIKNQKRKDPYKLFVDGNLLLFQLQNQEAIKNILFQKL